MQNEATPFGTLSDVFSSTGTAPAREVENMDLGETVPRTVDPIGVDKRLTRWICFVGDVIVPKQKRERPDLAIGGEYFGQQYATLVRSKGLVRRCQLTPMEIGFDFINDEILGENTTGLQIVGSIAPKGDQGDNTAAMLGSRKLNVVEIFPGDEIKGILNREHNSPNGVKGFVEIEILRGADFDTVRAEKVQEFLFPNWSQIITGHEKIENRIAALRQYFESVRDSTGRQDFKQIAEAYLDSCDRYEQWGRDYLKLSAQLVRQPMVQGFAHTYSDQAEMLFSQLGVTREDALRWAADAPPLSGPAVGAVTDSDTKELMHKMVEFQGQLAALMTAQAANNLQPSQAAAAPAPEAPAAPEVPVTPEAPAQPVHPDSEPPANLIEERESIQTEDGLALQTEDGRPRCQATNASTGTQCLQPAVEGTDRCAHPAHKR